jgi:flagellin-like hook-associated protein FlgL
MSIVGLYSKIQYLEAVIHEVKNAQAAASVADTTSFISGGSCDTACVHEDKVVDLTQLKEFNELSDKVNALQVVDSELSAKIADVPTLYVPVADFVALNAKVEKMDKLNNQMDKLNSKLDSFVSKVSSLESKVSSLESKVSSLESQTPA